ncbi:MBL fold metallo-hydrolase [Paenibacillus sp. J31TS4]|uniref:MBL fold metallo-hydrolase n=1 Tax=Paenibacillus sp. J31TS4 TaxID=2807195 RepID=UPI001B2E0738|nr:MBL fold metallo-hydrolase [Paenibacillus sp. J31TS4]GIP41247.1 MBL fold metallo-hydrolase [Paenibacillus sp. J31TS4]
MQIVKQAIRRGKRLIAQMEETRVPETGVAAWHLGQSGMALKRGGVVSYLDPYLSGDPGKRQFDPPMLPDEVTNASYVFLTHDHSDHLDPFTLNGIAKSSSQAVFICPAPHAAKLESIGIDSGRIVAAVVGETVTLNGVRFTAIPAKHEEFERDAEGRHLHLGYVLDLEGIKVYHAGDTLAYPELLETLVPHEIEIACLPINGHDFKRFGENLMGNMSFREAADLGAMLGADLIVPMHYDLFAHNTENPAYFVDYLHRAYPGQPYKLPVPGERFVHLSGRLEDA